MSNYSMPEMMSYIIGALFAVIVFSIAYAYLRPHKLHHSRPLSTLALKGTYLVYLLVMLVVIYFASLRGGGVSQVFDGPEFFIFLAVLFIPTAGIFSRKITRFSAKRERYNLVFTAVNIIMAITVLLLYRL
jgi:cytochrome bd-type quinol oxidase subunit 2